MTINNTLVDMVARWNREDAEQLIKERDEAVEKYRAVLRVDTDLQEQIDALRALNGQLTAERDDARRQRDECAARVAELEAYAKLADSDAEGEERRADELEKRVAEYEVVTEKLMAQVAKLQPEIHDQARTVLAALAAPLAPATNDDARAILHTLASQPANTAAVVAVVERIGDLLAVRWGSDGVSEGGELTTNEAVALVTALLADGAVHNAWLHGRGGK